MTGRGAAPERIARWAAVPLAALVYALFRFNLLDIPFDRDEGFFGYGGQVLLRGGGLYRDFIDHKPPLVFALHVVFLKFASPTPVALHTALHLWNALTAAALYALAQRWFGRAEALWAVVAYATIGSAEAVQGFTLSTENLLLFPLVLSAAVLPAAGPAPDRRRLFLSGALGAGAFWIKSQALFPIAAVAVLAGGVGALNERFRRWGIWMAGFLAAGALVASPFARDGRLGDLWFWTFDYNRLYAAGADFWRTGVLGTVRNLAALAKEHPASLALAALGAADYRRDRRPALWLGAGLAGALPGYAFPHYLALLVPGLALSAAQGVTALLRWKPWSALSPSARALALGAGVVALPLILSPRYYLIGSGTETSLRFFGANPFVESALIADYLRSRSDPGDEVFVLGSEPEILLAAELPSAVPFVNMRTLFDDRWAGHAAQQRTCLDVLRTRPPAWIIAFPPRLFLPERAQTAPAFFQELNALVAERYRPAAVVVVDETGGRLVEGGGQAPPPGGKIWIYRRSNPT